MKIGKHTALNIIESLYRMIITHDDGRFFNLFNARLGIGINIYYDPYSFGLGFVLDGEQKNYKLYIHLLVFIVEIKVG